MLLNFNPKSKTPIYIQMYREIKEKIHSRELATDEKLPSKRQLAELNNISENTVVNAYNQLLTEGYIYAIERKGYFVSKIDFHYSLPALGEMTEQAIGKQSPLSIDQKIRYDFTRSKPDEEIFPFSVFQKLYRQLFKHPHEQLLGETDGQGLYELRLALQRYLSTSRGVPCTAAQIILGPSTEYLLSILLQLVDKPPVMGIEDPGYHGFQRLFQRSGLKSVFVPVHDTGADIRYLAEAPVNMMIVTSNHQFPTGNITPLQQRQQLLAWANERENRYVIENDYDSEFKYSGIPISSLKYLDQNNRVIHLGSFTRVLSPGIRLSYMVLPDELLAVYQEKFASHSSALSTFEQFLIYDFIEGGHFATHLNRSRTFYKKKRDKMRQAIAQTDPDARIYGEKAGLHLLVRPSFSFDGPLFKQCASEAGIKLNLLSDYSKRKNDAYENMIFLSFSHIPEDEIEKIIQKIFDLAISAEIMI